MQTFTPTQEAQIYRCCRYLLGILRVQIEPTQRRIVHQWLTKAFEQGGRLRRRKD